MLEFIVLGLVPGTRLQVTFTWVLLVMLIIGLIALVFVEKPRIKTLVDRFRSSPKQPAH